MCTELRVGCTDADGRLSERVWLHPAAFDAAAVVDRVRWQLAAADGLRGGIAGVRLEPVAVDDAAHHEPGLFGAGVDERMHHALSRVQAMLGHEGVVTPVIAGAVGAPPEISSKPNGADGSLTLPAASTAATL